MSITMQKCIVPIGNQNVTGNNVYNHVAVYFAEFSAKSKRMRNNKKETAYR